jgi:hypothetical protein
MPLFDRVAELPLVVEHTELQPLAIDLPSAFVRRCTVVHLHGRGEEGIGEDVTYDEEMQLAFQREGPPPGLRGEWTLASLSDALPQLPGYRRWGVESAALDLALRQGGLALADALGRKSRPVTFVRSGRPDPEWQRLYPELRYKLDAADSWDEAFVAELRASGLVDVVDLKGLYEGQWVKSSPSALLYRLVAEGLPDVWLEDPALNEETGPVLAPHRDRITWDAAIRSVDDVDALPFPPRCLNSKPSRFGTIRRLFDFYDLCEERGIAIYGGGQFELGPGRQQIQHLASLFHSDGPNDVAPSAYNLGPVKGLPRSPLPPPSGAPGFRYE